MNNLEENQVVFVRDNDEGWVPARVKSNLNTEYEKKIALELECGDEFFVDDNKLDGKWCLADPLCFRGANDMVKMDVLTEGSVLHNMRVRYNQRSIYTSVGTILIAINPYQYRPDLYGIEKMEAYRSFQENSDFQKQPHPFYLMESAYRSLLSGNLCQSILISGESGAGKTETTKYLLQYLSHRCSNNSCDNASTIPVADAVVQQNPVMESFANAKTARNNNSSRFGKYIRVDLDSEGMVKGGHITTYLLEKMRVVKQLSGERNFHIFYQLCAGLDDFMRVNFGLHGGAESFEYLTGGECIAIQEVDDTKGFSLLKTCLGCLGLTDEDQNCIFKILSAILHLGNIHILPLEIEGQDAGSKVEDGTSNLSVQYASKLLAISPDRLIRSLTVALFGSAGSDAGNSEKNNNINKPLSVDGAISARNALAKTIYAAIFTWLVEKVNIALRDLGDGEIMDSKMDSNSSEKQHFIGILDIFGFESFDTNSLEQLLINYANERLQQQFNCFVFKLEQQEFEAEGLSAIYLEECKVEWSDNDNILTLFEAKPTGLLSLLNEEATFKNGNNENLLRRYRQGFDQFQCFSGLSPKRRNSSLASADCLTFGIKHFAGEVQYSIAGFVEKNRDSVPTALTDLILDSSDSFLVDILKMFVDVSNVNNKIQSKRQNSMSTRQTSFVTGKFQASLGSLLSTIGNTEPHYVKCIKPNSIQKINFFHGSYVLLQLQWMGMLQVVEIRKKGYNVRYEHFDFLKKFEKLGGIFLHSDKTSFSVQELVTNLEVQGLTDSRTEIRVGKSKIFLKNSVHQKLIEAKEIQVKNEVLETLSAAIESRNINDLKMAVISAIELRVSTPLTLQANEMIKQLIREYAESSLIHSLNKDDVELLEIEIERAREAQVALELITGAETRLMHLKKCNDIKKQLIEATTAGHVAAFSQCSSKSIDHDSIIRIDELLEKAKEVGVSEDILLDCTHKRDMLRQALNQESYMGSIETAMPTNENITLSKMSLEDTHNTDIPLENETIPDAEKALEIVSDAEMMDDAVIQSKKIENTSSNNSKIVPIEENEKKSLKKLEKTFLENKKRRAKTIQGLTKQYVQYKSSATDINCNEKILKMEKEELFLVNQRALTSPILNRKWDPNSIIRDAKSLILHYTLLLSKENHQATFLDMEKDELFATLQAGSQLLKINQSKISVKHSSWKFVQLVEKSRITWIRSENVNRLNLATSGQSSLNFDQVTHVSVGLQTKGLFQKWENTPVHLRLPTRWHYFSLHTDARTYDFGCLNSIEALAWIYGINLLIPENACKTSPLSQAQYLFQQLPSSKPSAEIPVPICPILVPICSYIARAAQDLKLGHPKYGHQWHVAVEMLERPLDYDINCVSAREGVLMYSCKNYNVSFTHPLVSEYMKRVDLSDTIPVTFDTSFTFKILSNPPKTIEPVEVFVACLNGRTEIIADFAAEGGKVDCRYRSSYTRVWNAKTANMDLLWAEPLPGDTPLTYICTYSDIIDQNISENVVETLLKLGANPNQNGGGRSKSWIRPLHGAISCANLPIIRLLLQWGASVDQMSGDGRIPLHVATSLDTSAKKISILAVLLVAGAHINAQDTHFKNTALHIAALVGDSESVDFLLASGADSSIINRLKRTPLEAACEAADYIESSLTSRKSCIEKVAK